MSRISRLVIAFFLANSLNAIAQTNDSITIRKIYTYSLEQGKAYERLRYLTTEIGPRLSGSIGASDAVKWGKSELESENFGKVTLQEVMVPHWVRNNVEELSVPIKGKQSLLRICSLGGSIPTPPSGIKAKVIEVKSFEELEQLGKEKIAGKIVFYNTPMPQKYISTNKAYGETGKYRYRGAANAAKFGAIASITRSLTLSTDDHPHTGAMGYVDSIAKIPTCAISTIGADKLSALLKVNPETEVSLTMNCETLPDNLSYNVIAEIKGSEFPDEIIVVGGHLDAWDTGKGAHDDGSGIVQSMEVLNIFKDLNIQPKRTIRVVLFMNEENGVRGGKKYAEAAKAANEKHLAAIESDGGGFTPHGFTCETKDSTLIPKFKKWNDIFAPYGLYNWESSGGGSDIDPLQEQGAFLIGLLPDSQRYFDYHHTEIDTFDKVNRRELHLGAAAMASMVYLLSEYGLK